MAKSSTRRVTIYINGKEVEASVKQIREEIDRLHNGQNRMVVVGDSATSYRRRRNDVRRRMRGREKMGGGESLSVASDTISAAHLFPLLPRARRTSFHETRERRAEPPTASARRSEEGCPTAPQSATVRRPCRRHDTRRQAQITPHKRSAVWGVRVRCRGQRVGDTPLFRGNVACHGFCTNLPIFCGNFTRFWTEDFFFCL